MGRVGSRMLCGTCCWGEGGVKSGGWRGSHCDGLSEEPGVLTEGSDSAQGEERAEPSLEGRDPRRSCGDWGPSVEGG